MSEKTQIFAVRLMTRDLKKVKQIAKDQHRTPSGMIRHIISSWITDMEKRGETNDTKQSDMG